MIDMGKDTAKRYPCKNWDFNLDGMSDYYLIKGYWKKHFKKLRRRELKIIKEYEL